MRLNQIIKYGILGAAFAALTPAALSTSAAAAAPATPLVRITMTDGVTAPRLGDRVAYTVTLTDRDKAALVAQIRMAAPPGLTNMSIVDGNIVGRELTWAAQVAPGGTASAKFTGTVAGLSTRLATTACAYVGDGTRPIACASDLDRVALPAAGHGGVIAITSTIAGLILLGAGGFLLRRRRRTAGTVTLPAARAATSEASDASDNSDASDASDASHASATAAASDASHPTESERAPV
jgi:LPXTG-motif cell wall-anchored protein